MKENPIPWRVIRAAPDMLEALEELLALADETRKSAFDAGVVSDLPRAFGRKDFADKARAAIAKAKGELQPEERKEYAAK
jgi:hypothetical protein